MQFFSDVSVMTYIKSINLILEVPVQNKPVPQNILDYATKNNITIRDIKEFIYNK